MSLIAEFQSNGYVVVADFISTDEVDRLLEHACLSGDRAGTRLLLDTEWGRAIAEDPRVVGLASNLVGAPAFPVRGILFDKTPETNWALGWHQDTKIAVAGRAEVEGYDGWSTKEGVDHVRPPHRILVGMVALRIHLDDCGPENGPLQVSPGTHRLGMIPKADVDLAVRDNGSVSLSVPRGGLIAMHPLTLHGSPRATSPRHRRVIHIEFASERLDGGLEWAYGGRS